VRLLAALFTPDRGVPALVTHGRYAAALLAVVLAASASAWAIGAKIDMSSAVYEKMDGRGTGGSAGEGGGGGGGGQGEGQGGPEQKSDAQIEEDIAKATSVQRVTLGLSAGLGTPFVIFLLSLGVFVLSWFVGGKPKLLRSLTASAAAYLPQAVKSLVVAGAALRRAVLTPADLPTLAVPGDLVARGPNTPAAAKFLAGVDPFFLWSVLCLVFGFAAAAQVSRKKAVPTVIVCTVLYLLLTRMGGQ
jgi:hypothetical protein